MTGSAKKDMREMELDSIEECAGITTYFTKASGLGGRLRARVDDFRVEELPQKPPEEPDGEYTVARVTVRNWETNRLIRELARRLRIPTRDVTFAGTKDKRGITSQYFTFKVPEDAVRQIDLSGVEIDDIYTTKHRLDLGKLLGNGFELVLREISLEREDAERSASSVRKSLLDLGGFPNFFGLQRFGVMRPVTHIIGKRITEQDFKGAVMAYLGNPFEKESDDVKRLRKLIDDTEDFEVALRILPPGLTFERMLLSHLVKKPDDYTGALAILPKNLSMMFVHAYQSYLFNLVLSERIKRGLPLNVPSVGDVILPVDKNGLPDHKTSIEVTEGNLEKISKRVRERKAFISGIIFGSESEFPSREQGEIERKIIEDEKIEAKQFFVPEVPKLSSKGMRREMLGQVDGLLYEFLEDAKEPAMRFRFRLTKGCYATSLMREFMKASAWNY